MTETEGVATRTRPRQLFNEYW